MPEETKAWDRTALKRPTATDGPRTGDRMPGRGRAPIEFVSGNPRMARCRLHRQTRTRGKLPRTKEVWCEWDIRQARNGRTPPFPRPWNHTPLARLQSSRLSFRRKKKRDAMKERTGHLGHPLEPLCHAVSPQTCPPTAPSLIETSLVRNSLAQSSDRCTHGSGIQQVGTSSGQIGLTKMVLSGRPLRSKSPRTSRPRLRSDGVDSCVPGPGRRRAARVQSFPKVPHEPRRPCVLRAVCT